MFSACDLLDLDLIQRKLIVCLCSASYVSCLIKDRISGRRYFDDLGTVGHTLIAYRKCISIASKRGNSNRSCIGQCRYPTCNGKNKIPFFYST